MDKKEWLDFVDRDDEYGLLKIKERTTTVSAEEHLLIKFQEINEFFNKNNREPPSDLLNITELMLYQRLNAIRNNKDYCLTLQAHDIYRLLPAVEPFSEALEKPKAPKQRDINSLDDIFDDDSFGLLDEGEESIFNLRHVPKKIDMPDKMAKRKRCENFEIYEPFFVACHADLQIGEKVAVPFTGEQQIQKAQFFILNGVMCYVSDMGERKKKNGKTNAKLHLVFENGTESNMLMRSLAVELYKDENGRRVMAKTENALNNMAGIDEDDNQSGYVYVLRSLSNDPKIKSLEHLFKIGYSSVSAEKRIANAQNEPTYLMAPVHLVAQYECFNRSSEVFEDLLHTFFGHVCLDIEVTDSKGQICRPREWFLVPYSVIDTAMALLVSGDIVSYRYDSIQQAIVERN